MAPRKKAAAPKAAAKKAASRGNGTKTSVMKDGSVVSVTSKGGKPVSMTKTTFNSRGRPSTTRHNLPLG